MSTSKVVDVPGNGNGIGNAVTSDDEVAKPFFRQQCRREDTVASSAPDELTLHPQPHSRGSDWGSEWNSMRTCAGVRIHQPAASPPHPSYQKYSPRAYRQRP